MRNDKISILIDINKLNTEYPLTEFKNISGWLSIISCVVKIVTPDEHE